MRAWHPVQLYICGFIQLNLHSKNALQNTHTVIYTYRQQSPRWHKWQRHAYYPFSDCSKYWLNDRLFKVPILTIFFPYHVIWPSVKGAWEVETPGESGIPFRTQPKYFTRLPTGYHQNPVPPYITYIARSTHFTYGRN